MEIIKTWLVSLGVFTYGCLERVIWKNNKVFILKTQWRQKPRVKGLAVSCTEVARKCPGLTKSLWEWSLCATKDRALHSHPAVSRKMSIAGHGSLAPWEEIGQEHSPDYFVTRKPFLPNSTPSPSLSSPPSDMPPISEPGRVAGVLESWVSGPHVSPKPQRCAVHRGHKAFTLKAVPLYLEMYQLISWLKNGRCWETIGRCPSWQDYLLLRAANTKFTVSPELLTTEITLHQAASKSFGKSHITSLLKILTVI